MKTSDTIILHDAFEFKGGGERLVQILCRELGADLAFGYKKNGAIDTSLLSGHITNLESGSSLPLWRTFKRLYCFYRETKFLSNYKNVIYTGQNSPLAVSNNPKGKNIYYCFTPPRSIYDLKDAQLEHQPPAKKLTHKLYNSSFQLLYESAIRKMDLIVADSKNVQSRIKKFLDLESIIIYPPCDVDKFCWVGQEDYYLSTARLAPYKRVDIIIQAFINLPNKRLIVTSTGPEERYLKQLAKGYSNIQFTGDINDQQLQKLIGNSIATIYIPKDEDFGMSPLESMASGKPVIGAGEGGLLETVIHGKTGWLSKLNPSPEELVLGIQEMTPQKALSMRLACEEQAKKFRTENFIEKMLEIID